MYPVTGASGGAMRKPGCGEAEVEVIQKSHPL